MSKATRKFNAAEVLDILEEVQDDGLDQEEPEHESDGVARIVLWSVQSGGNEERRDEESSAWKWSPNQLRNLLILEFFILIFTAQRETPKLQ